MKPAARIGLVGLVSVVVASGSWFAWNSFSDLFGHGRAATACEQAYRETLSSVNGVTAVEVECNLQFGGGWQRVKVALDAADDQAAMPLVAEALKALAADGRLDGSWATPSTYILVNGVTTKATLASLGFSRQPTIGAVRQHFSITPTTRK